MRRISLPPRTRPLFDEAVAAANAGALRAANLMIWLACAESLKRRFREAQVRDNAAGKVVGKVEGMEKEGRAVDKFLLNQALDYGFLSDSGHTILGQVYEMRCIYGHPYEEAPSQEKVKDAAADVVELILSQPVKLRQGFGKQLLGNLLEERNYLDDQSQAVVEFAQNILPRIDEGIYIWLLDEYWKELEKLSDDASMAVFFRRGIWFCTAVLAKVGVAALTDDAWHDRFVRFPKTLMRVCSTAYIFKDIGELAQDSLVGNVLKESETRASVLSLLERLNDQGALSERQQERFTNHVSEMPMSTVTTSGLRTKTCYGKLLQVLKSGKFQSQNSAIRLVLSNGPEQAAELTEDQQVDLGRNVLDAGQGGAWSAAAFLKELSPDATIWPFGVIRGFALESFTNDDNDIRLKNRQLDLVLSVLVRLDSIQRDELIAEIVASVDAREPQGRASRDDFNQGIALLNAHTWAEPLVSILKAKLQAEEQE